MMKELGTLWSTIDPIEKHYFEKLATEGILTSCIDKQRYEAEL